MPVKVFISYSHKDSLHLERLHTHLAVLRREGKIEAWFDRNILGGGEIDAEISVELEHCDIFLALVSPDFLASNYCYEQEMQRAIARHEAGKSRVVPIILEPCDWQSTPLRQFKAIPRDGKPVTEWQNQNNAFLDVVTELRRIVADDNGVRSSVSKHPVERGPLQKEGRRYRAKRDFDDVDRADFRDESFKAIRDYIHSAIAEIDGIENIKARFANISPYCFSCTILNRARERGAGHLTVHARTGNSGFGEIYYSFSENAPTNTANGSFNLEADDYELFLKHGFSMSSNANEKLTAPQAAESLWNDLLKRSGVSYA